MTTPLLLRFVSEARDLLQLAAKGLLQLERSPGDAATINEVFRAIHTLKGSVGLFDFPAFAKLVHAGEDLLSAVREGRVSLTSALVDLLLDALDQIGGWIDAIEAEGALPAGADGISREMTLSLRAVLPEDLAHPAPAAAPTIAALACLDWLGAISEADRQAAFAAAVAGDSLLALDYQPLEDCFFSGEDPLNLFRQMSGLCALLIEPIAPWPEGDGFDPYACHLRFRALTTTPRLEIEPLFRYVIEQVALVTVAPQALVIPAGAAGGGPVYGDFLEEALPLCAAGDWPALRRAVEALLRLTSGDLFIASALRWLQAVLAMPAPEPGWVAALLEAIETGQPVPLPAPGGTEAVSESPQAASAGGLSAGGRAILDAQQTLLRLNEPETLPGRLAAVERTVSNVLRASGGDCAHWTLAAEAARASGSAPAMLAALAPLLGLAGEPEPGEVAGGEAVETIVSAAHDSRAASRILKVDQAKVDALMNLIGELVVSKNSLPFLARRAETVHGSREMAREIKDLYTVIDRLAQEMQGAIMAVRMLPVSEVFERFPRLVRDVARRLDKQVELVIEGEDTAADKTMIELLGDPLLHILRNALDHGIEPPEERVAAGKPALARLMVRAFQESDQVVIEVVDDGRGIDPVRIRASAVAKGVIDPERAARLTDQEAVNLVFLPGFSTADQVSDLSGRGVGMDVVATTVDKVNGTVSLTSTCGVGTTVRLSLPLSMAVTRVMMVEAGGGLLFGIPMDHIAETVRVPRRAMHQIKQVETFVLRETIVPLLRLDQLLGLMGATRSAPREEEAVLVVRIGGALTGLVVDHFREGMDIILKPFEGILAGIRSYAGTALLGDGRVLLVLNLKELL